MDERESVSQQTHIEPRLLTLEDVATYLSVSVPQVYTLVRSGSLLAVTVGGRGIWRVDRHELDLFVDRLHEDAIARSPAAVERREDTDREEAARRRLLVEIPAATYSPAQSPEQYHRRRRA